MRKFILAAFLILPIEHAIAAPAEEYLLPSPEAIPQGFTLFLRSTKEGYGLQYNRGVAGRIMISESTSTPGLNYDQSIKSYDTLIKIGEAEKIKDVQFKELSGVLFYMKNKYIPGSGSYDLYLNDNGKVLRIFTGDTDDFHFSPEKVEAILNGLVRGTIDPNAPLEMHPMM